MASSRGQRHRIVGQQAQQVEQAFQMEAAAGAGPPACGSSGLWELGRVQEMTETCGEGEASGTGGGLLAGW